jgi:predicted transcriptional regulator
MQVLLSIKPQYSQKIFSGEKKYEFRRRKPKCAVDRVFVYESSPAKNIVGWFSVKHVLVGSPEEASGIEKSNYFSYCRGRDIVYAFEIDEISKFAYPMDPFELFCDFKPPQSFLYLDGSKIDEIIEKRSTGIQDRNENCPLNTRGSKTLTSYFRTTIGE